LVEVLEAEKEAGGWKAVDSIGIMLFLRSNKDVVGSRLDMKTAK
jgi:hypothetical protein